MYYSSCLIVHIYYVYIYISGLKINLDKNKLIPLGRVENLEKLALEIGCKVGNLSFVYLAFHLGALFKSMIAWDGGEREVL